MKLLRKLFGTWEKVEAKVVKLDVRYEFTGLDKQITRTLLIEKHSRTGEERAFLINLQNEREPAEIHMARKYLGLD